MHTPHRGRVSVPMYLIALLALLAALALTITNAAHASPAPTLLKQGSHGQRVRDIQWLLSGGKPSVYTGIRTLHRNQVDGVFGRNTAAAVIEMKKRLGFPARALEPVAGTDLFRILTGKTARPIGYVRRATVRLATTDQITADTASTSCAKRAIAIARGELGVHEIPDGSNDSPRIRVYQAVTGAFRAPWCASFVQWVLKTARIGFPKTAWSSAIADNSAGVFHIVDWSRAHGWLRAIPKPGNLIAFTSGLGHIGLVERVSSTGVTSIEGNASNSVLERFHPFGARPEVFISVPGCSAG